MLLLAATSARDSKTLLVTSSVSGTQTVMAGIRQCGNKGPLRRLLMFSALQVPGILLLEQQQDSLLIHLIEWLSVLWGSLQLRQPPKWGRGRGLR